MASTAGVVEAVGGVENLSKRPQNPYHKVKRELTDNQKKFIADYDSARTQAFKQATVNSKNSLVYFDRPGDEVEGYLIACMPVGAMSSANFIMEYHGATFEIKAHALLREIVNEFDLIGEYVRIVFRGRVHSRFFRKCQKSYHVYHGKGDLQKLLAWKYPKLEDEKPTQLTLAGMAKN